MTKYAFFMGLVHLLGDFYFQTEAIAKEKEKSYKGVIKHSLEYALVAMALALFVFHVDMLIAALIGATVHFMIDSIKYILIKKRVCKIGWTMFFTDQCVHLTSILLISVFLYKYNFVMNTRILSMVTAMISIDLNQAVKWLLVVLLIIKPSNILIQKFLAEYRPISGGDDVNAIIATKNAGVMIGTIERIIMIILIYLGQYSALGLVLTAKSITRYNKISNEKDFAEYYLLGTLLSFLCVLVASLLVK